MKTRKLQGLPRDRIAANEPLVRFLTAVISAVVVGGLLMALRSLV